MPFRHLFAYLGKCAPERAALLRFPPGVTLEDAGYDWASVTRGVREPTLPRQAVTRLRDLGVEVVAGNLEALSEALRRARVENAGSDVGAFADDCLDANACLGGRRCVSVEEYAMHTVVGDEQPLRDVLRDRLLNTSGVRMYGGAAFRDGSLPGVLSLRVGNIAVHELSPPTTPVGASCRLHGDWCYNYGRHWDDPGYAIRSYVPLRCLGLRVDMPRRLLDGLAVARGSWDFRRFAQAALPVALRVLDALPEDAKEDTRLPWSLAPLVALAAARTCEEHAMLVRALWECGSLREMVRRARDTSWAVTRALEAMS